MNAIELKIPPVAIVVVCATAMWLLSVVVPTFQVSLPLRHTIAVVLSIGGGGVALSGVASFRREKTTVNPFKPDAAATLVTSGVYRFTRNPMYLGLLVILIGWSVFLANILSAFMLAGFVLYMNRFQIKPEEKALSARFGGAFADYCKRVRRWL